MKYLKKVQGTQDTVLPLEINVDTVYIRSNITRCINEEYNTEYWEYDEKQLSLQEYFKEILPENENAICELSYLLSTYQQQIDNALAELSVIIGGNK